MRKTYTVLALALIASAVGCGQSITASTATPGAARFDGGGFTLGGGNVVPTGGTTTTGKTTAECTDERGGFTLGGGNFIDPCAP